MAKNTNVVKVWKINLRIFTKKFKNLRDINFERINYQNDSRKSNT